jgi:hypothetical protein
VKFFWQHEYGQTETIDNEPKMAEIYEARNRSVVEFFRDKADQLLVLDLEVETHPWQRICAFLNESVPVVPFPHLNRTK